jgi:CheY-like chemotaxis protein
MSPKYTVWLVDDLPQNRASFEANHRNDFAVETFSKTSDVLTRIHNGKYPDALLCDVFFYDSVEEAEHVEKSIADLAENLKRTAIKLGVHDHTHAIGIALMRQIYQHFKNRHPPFPMYAYTSKGPFLLEQAEWDRISEYGAEVLLKGRVTAEGERAEIVGDIEFYRSKNSWTAKVKNAAPTLFWTLVEGVFFIFLSLAIGRLVRGTW